MKPINQFLIKLPKKFKDEIDFAGGKLHLVNKFKEFEHRINYGEIVGYPTTYKGKDCIGDTLYFHHHVVLEKRFDIGDDLFLVDYYPDGGYLNHSIAIEDKEGNISMLSDWCFVSVPEEDHSLKETDSGLVLIEDKPEPPTEGELLNVPKDFEWIGAKCGDIVGYTKNSDYLMHLSNGGKVFRMRATELVYVKEG